MIQPSLGLTLALISAVAANWAWSRGVSPSPRFRLRHQPADGFEEHLPECWIDGERMAPART